MMGDKLVGKVPKEIETGGIALMTNAEFTKDSFFRECCELAGVEPTTRQASKFRNKKGIAYRFRNHPKKGEPKW